MDATKKCIKCHKILSINDFYKNSVCNKGIRNMCKECVKAGIKKSRDPNYRKCEVCKQYKELDAFDDSKILITVKCIDCWSKSNNQSSILCFSLQNPIF